MAPEQILANLCSSYFFPSRPNLQVCFRIVELRGPAKTVGMKRCFRKSIPGMWEEICVRFGCVVKVHMTVVIQIIMGIACFY